MDNLNSPANTKQPQTMRRPAHRISAADLALAKEVLFYAMILMTPDDYTQYKAFEELMPALYVLEGDGWTFEQLTELVNKSGKFKLQCATVRRYFSEFKKHHLETCQPEMNEQILLIKELRSKMVGVDLTVFPGGIAAILRGFYP